MPTTIANPIQIRTANFLKNSNFAVIQGAASGTVPNSLALPTATAGYLGETEWGVAAAGGTPTYAFSQINENVTFTGAASTTAIHLLQRLESRDANKLKNKTVTLSCEISNSLLTSVTWELFNPSTTDDAHGTIAVPTQTLISNGTFTVSSTLTRYSATVVLPANASRGLEVRLRVGAQVSGTWVVSRLQLEEGSTATSFSCGNQSEELSRCQRYFDTGTHYEAGYNTSGFFWERDILFTPKFTALTAIATSGITFGGFAGLVNINVTSKKFTYRTDASVNTGQHFVSFSWSAFAHIP